MDQEMDTNVVSFKCSQLAETVALHTGDVQLCGGCRVAFSTASKVVASKWTCEVRRPAAHIR